MTWTFLILAGLFEMLGHQKVFLLILGFGASLSLSFYCDGKLAYGHSLCRLDGIGASRAAIIGMLFFIVSKDWKRILFIAMVLGAAVGLKLVS